jgi:hypothetical protein
MKNNEDSQEASQGIRNDEGWTKIFVCRANGFVR